MAFVKEEMFNGKEIYILATNVLILATVRLLGLLKQKIELQMVTGSYSDFAR